MHMRQFLIALSVSLAFIGTPLAADWQTYQNPRFGTVAEVPADFIAGEEPQNGDGLKFFDVDSDGEINVYGAFNVMGDDLAGYRDFLLQIYKDGGWTIGRENSGDTWFMVSAKREDRRLFLRVEHGAGCAAELLHHIEFRYPADAQKRWQSFIKHGAESLDGPCP
ncbi:hypothetical protein [Roseibium sp.]|uniref:hypothetical protein n=1 Tax=Roseibium sp. TaxID=1936156 RepID=UPI003A978BC8